MLEGFGTHRIDCRLESWAWEIETTGASFFFFFFGGEVGRVAGLGLCCCTRASSSCGEQGLLSNRGVWASHCSGFSCGA